MSNKMRVYIAGPMSGIPGYNFEEFDKFENLFKDEYEVVNPANISRELAKKNNFSLGNKEEVEKHRHLMMREDLKQLLTCDIIFLLKDWYQSIGANTEYAVAHAAGITVTYED
jgi:hypothetical protein